MSGEAEDCDVRCAGHGCSQVVQLRRFTEHAKDHRYFKVYNEENCFRSIVSKNFLVWDGKSKDPRNKFDLEIDQATQGLLFEQLDKRYSAIH